MPRSSAKTGILDLSPELDYLQNQFANFLVDWETPSVRRSLKRMGFEGKHDYLTLPPEAIYELAQEMEDAWKALPWPVRVIMLEVGQLLRQLGLQLDSPQLQPFLHTIGCQSRTDFDSKRFSRLRDHLLDLEAQRICQQEEAKRQATQRPRVLPPSRKIIEVAMQNQAPILPPLQK